MARRPPLRGSVAGVRRWRVPIAGLCLSSLVLAVLVISDSLPGSRVALASGSAWLASSGPGLVTLFDGPSEMAVLSLPLGTAAVPEPAVFQVGSSALVVDSAAGTLRRVDGAQQRLGRPVQVGSGPDLAVFTGGGRTYVVDPTRREAAVIDPVSLQVGTASPLPLPSGPGQGAVDDQGRLWLVDRDSGRLWWVDGSGDAVQSELGSAGTRVVVVQGRAVLLDALRREAGWVDSSGELDVGSCWDARATDQVQAFGSTSSPWVFGAVSETGTVVAADLESGDCPDPVPVGEPGDTFGSLVEAHGFVLVPNQTSGQVAVIDAATGRLVTRLDVLPAGSSLELVVDDDVVFYNDVNGDTAGVISFSVGAWTVGEPGKKYGEGGASVLSGGEEPGPAVPVDPPVVTAAGSGGGPGPAGQGGQSAGEVVGAPPPPAGPDGRGLPPTAAGESEPAEGPRQPDPTEGSGESNPAAPETSGQPSVAPGQQGSGVRTLTLEVRGEGRIVVSPEPREGPAHCTAECRLTFGEGTDVQLSISNPSTGDALESVTGPCAHADRSTDPVVCRFALAGDVSVAVTYTARHREAPVIHSLEINPHGPSAGQPATTSASVSDAGSDATWTWTITGPVTASSSAVDEFSHVFPRTGTYEVRLTVRTPGGEASRSLHVSVGPTVGPGEPMPNPLDLVASTSGVVRLPYPYCDLDTDGVQVHVASGLTESSGWEAPGSPHCAYVVTVTRSGIPGEGGRLPGAVFFIVNGGSGPSVDVIVPEKPPPLAWNGYAECAPGQGIAWFYADFTGPELPSLAVTLTVGGVQKRMEYVDGGGAGHGEFWALSVLVAELPDVTTWSVSARSGSESAASGARPRGTCW